MTPTYLTEQDEQNYGRDLIDFATRAAAHAVAPSLAALDQQQQQLRHQLAIEARRNLDAAVERAVPNYREIDRDEGWHRWLLGVDALSGQIRQQLLNSAIANGDQGRVISFFRQYQNSGQTTGETGGQSRRARAGAPSGGPTYSNESIRKLYENSDADWARLEADLSAAFKENRVLAKPFLSK